MEKLVSIYQFSKLAGKPAQYFYGLHREGKIPAEIIVMDEMKGQPMLKLEEAQAWYLARKNAPKSNNQPVQMVQGLQPNDILGLLVEWFDKAGKKAVSRDLKKVLDQINNDQENQQ